MKFSPANAKTEALYNVDELRPYLANKRKVYSFDLLSGHSCPFADRCLSKVVIEDGKRKIQDGPNTEFRCFSASQEVIYTNAYNSRKANFEALKGRSYGDMVNLIAGSLPKNAGIIRIHVAGDFFNKAYFRAWVQVASNRPDVLFYAYTKSLPYWVEAMDIIPANFVLTASRGGRADGMISEHNLREAVVIYSEGEAAALGYEIDHTDEHACRPSLAKQSFALLLHGAQPKGSAASVALQQLKKNNVQHSYSRK